MAWNRTNLLHGAVLIALSWLLSPYAMAVSQPWIDMGAKDQIAATQPQARIEVLSLDGQTSLGPGSSTGDPLLDLFGGGSTLLVDTGASSLFLMNAAETGVLQNGYVIENQVLEQGVSGFSLVNVSTPYQVKITGDDGTQHVLPEVRLLSGQFPDLFGVNGLIGMPGMVGRVMTMELDFTIDPNDILNFKIPETRFSDDLPATSGHRYSIPFIGKRFDLEDPPPLPTSAPLPMIDIKATLGAASESGDFILDTGAAVSFISSEIATGLGLDSNEDGEFDVGDDLYFDTLPIGGVGGTINAPMFSIDTFRVATNEGVDLIWDEVQVLIVDIHPEIDGVIGSDVISSGLLDLLGLGDGEGEGGPIELAHFDFRTFFDEGDSGALVLDLNPEFDVVQVPLTGDFNNDGVVDAADFVVWREGLGTDYQQEHYYIWRANFGATRDVSPSTAVPEPAGGVLYVSLSLLGGFRRSRARRNVGRIEPPHRARSRGNEGTENERSFSLRGS